MNVLCFFQTAHKKRHGIFTVIACVPYHIRRTMLSFCVFSVSLSLFVLIYYHTFVLSIVFLPCMCFFVSRTLSHIFFPFSYDYLFPSRIVYNVAAVAVWLTSPVPFVYLYFLENNIQINCKGSIISHCGMGTSGTKYLFRKIIKLFHLKMCNLVEMVTHFGCCCWSCCIRCLLSNSIRNW